MRRLRPTVADAFDLARLGAEAWMVVALRLAKLAAGGPAAALEAQRMVAEKSAAALEAHLQSIPELARPLPDLDALAARPPLRAPASA